MQAKENIDIQLLEQAAEGYQKQLQTGGCPYLNYLALESVRNKIKLRALRAGLGKRGFSFALAVAQELLSEKIGENPEPLPKSLSTGNMRRSAAI